MAKKNLSEDIRNYINLFEGIIRQSPENEYESERIEHEIFSMFENKLKELGFEIDNDFYAKKITANKIEKSRLPIVKDKLVSSKEHVGWDIVGAKVIDNAKTESILHFYATHFDNNLEIHIYRYLADVSYKSIFDYEPPWNGSGPVVLDLWKNTYTGTIDFDVLLKRLEIRIKSIEDVARV